MIKLKDLKPNPENPRVIKNTRFKKLMQSIQEFPKMMALRPMVINEDNVVLGGNMRLKALKELGYKEIPEEWIKKASDLTPEEVERFIVIDNVGFGEHDWAKLKTEWNVDLLGDWGLELPAEKAAKEEGEMVFSTELDRESNYIVMKFDKDIDFIHIQTILGIDSTYSRRANGKPWSKGVGRVVDGVEAMRKIKEA